MKKVKFDIQGMTCSSCSAHVEKAVNKIDGIKKVTVNLLSNNMIVEYDEKISTNNDIVRAVENAGYGASIAECVDKQKYLFKNNLDKKDFAIMGMKKRLILSLVFLIPLMYIAMHNMLFERLGIPIPQIFVQFFHGGKNAFVFALVQLLLLIPIIYVNRSYFINGFKRLIKGTPTMDSLIAIGSGTSTIYSIYTLCSIGQAIMNNDFEQAQVLTGNLYFESAGTILTLITFGKYLESKSKAKTKLAIEKLIALAPKTAIIEINGEEKEILTNEIKEGDIVIIKPGSNVPVDGRIISGITTVDQSSITGESIPIDKNIGDIVMAGTINKNGYIKIDATKVGEDTTLSQIIKLVEEASNSKAPISKIADKVSGIFVPLVILIAILAMIVWLMNGQSMAFSLDIAISVLVISCPCALGLATPVAIMVGTGKGANHGILIKSAEILETLHSIDTVVFDKTGTITSGRPKLLDIVTTSGGSKKELLKLIASLEKNSEHPLAEAITSAVEAVELYEVDKFQAVLGRGVQGIINKKQYFAGNEAFMKENKIEFSKDKQFVELQENILNEGKTILYFAEEKRLLGFVVIADTIKESAYMAIDALKNKKIDLIMITGDNKAVADSIGKELGIGKVIAEVLPQDKEKEISKLQGQKRKVAFVGDGINDSPALARADVGIAIGTGTDIAIESADVVLKNDNLLNIATAIELSKAVINNIKMNLFWAFFYNIIGIPVAAGVFYGEIGLKLSPMIGAAAMSLSSVCVVTNALTLTFFKPKYRIDNSKLANQLQLGNELIERVKNMYIKEIGIDGMQCNHCKMTVEKSLSSLEGVTKVEVDLANKVAVLESKIEIENEKIYNIIEEAGFNVIEIK